MPRGDRLTWYRMAFPSRPSDDACPLLVLHGGPGQTSDYVSSLEALTAGGAWWSATTSSTVADPTCGWEQG